MTKPEVISQSAWDEALKVAGTVCRNLPDDYGDLTIEVTAIARAVMAATERAALIAQNWQPPQQDATEPTKLYRPFEVADAIAAAIRQGAQPSNAIPHNGEIA